MIPHPIVIIDNYDSFTYNLYQALASLGAQVEVLRHDAVTVEQLELMAPAGLVISPGPGVPDQAGISLDCVARLGGVMPILGVCLGHQVLGQVFGGRVVRATRPVHGETSPIFHDGQTIYRGLPNPFTATRYHSLLVERDTLPGELQISAWSDTGEIMGLRHCTLPLEGVQFHPESVLTDQGGRLLQNFLSIIDEHLKQSEEER